EQQRNLAERILQENRERTDGGAPFNLSERLGRPIGLPTGVPTNAPDSQTQPSGMTASPVRFTEQGRQHHRRALDAQQQLENVLQAQVGGISNRRLEGPQQAVLVGADVIPTFNPDDVPFPVLTSNHAQPIISNINQVNNSFRYGDGPPRDRRWSDRDRRHWRDYRDYRRDRDIHLNIFVNGVFNQFQNNIIPDPYRPWGNYGRVRQPLYYSPHINPYFLPPPAPLGRDSIDLHLSWNYWDGHSYYDHNYASSLFMSVGHTRHNGFDGMVVDGRYWSYGYGWLDGCIDYGSRRMWVPGFWAPYTVEECGSAPIWIPPVYEDVWPGFCWERILVDGGYFVESPLTCRLVTRYTWIPGHYQYYY